MHEWCLVNSTLKWYINFSFPKFTISDSDADGNTNDDGGDDDESVTADGQHDDGCDKWR